MNRLRQVAQGATDESSYESLVSGARHGHTVVTRCVGASVSNRTSTALHVLKRGPEVTRPKSTQAGLKERQTETRHLEKQLMPLAVLRSNFGVITLAPVACSWCITTLDKSSESLPPRKGSKPLVLEAVGEPSCPSWWTAITNGPRIQQFSCHCLVHIM